MARMLKNIRHETFVKLYLKEMANGGTATAAYQQVYPNAKGFNCATAGACNLLRQKKIKARIRSMRMEIKRKADITFEKVLSDYQEAMNMARAKGDPGNIIAAAREQAKLVGLLIDRKEVGAAGDFENMESISDVLEAVAKQSGPEAALALSQAFKLMPPTIVKVEAPKPEDSEALLEAKPGSDAVN